MATQNFYAFCYESIRDEEAKSKVDENYVSKLDLQNHLNSIYASRRQISASELETLEHSYRNDSNYKSAANCKKLALEFGLKYTQIRRWFMVC